MNSSYMPYRQFGSNVPTSNDPLTYCLADTMDKNFQHGSNSVLYGPRSAPCDQYMAQRCAKKWDGFCQYYMVEHSKQSGWPNNRVWPDMAQPNVWHGQTSKLSLGEQLLKNTVEAKYCEYPGCIKKEESFNPLDPNSPKITYWTDETGAGGCVPVCRVDPETVDNDVVMDLALQNPRVAGNTLINIINTAQREGLPLAGTKIGSVGQNYLRNIQQFKR